MVAARTMLGRQLAVFTANADQEVSAAFQSMAQQRIAALIVSTDASFIARRDQITALATQNAIPAIYPLRTYVEVGGLVSYGVETQFPVSAGWHLCGPHPQRRKVFRPAGAVAHQIRAGIQPQDRKGARPRNTESCSRWPTR